MKTAFRDTTQYKDIFKIQSEALLAIHEFMSREGILQLMPVVLSPITDPLNHSVHDASIDYLGQKLQLTKSMILHKQIAISTLDARGVYIVSPNVRLEKGLRTDRHLLEFSQLDIELKGASAKEFRFFMEELMVHVFTRVGKTCAKQLDKLGLEIRIPKRPFDIYSSWDLREEYGPDFEQDVSFLHDDLFWITDFEREFYDKEDEMNPGHYVNYDLFYPKGYGEALSGGERDFEYEVLVRKILERNQRPEDFASYLDLAEADYLVPSAGGGLGIERLVRFLTGREHIKDVTLFPKVPMEPIRF